MINKSYVVVKENNDSNGNILTTSLCGEYNTKEEAIKKYNEVIENNPGAHKMENGYIETYVALRIHNDEDNCDTDNIIEMQVYNY